MENPMKDNKYTKSIRALRILKKSYLENEDLEQKHEMLEILLAIAYGEGYRINIGRVPSAPRGAKTDNPYHYTLMSSMLKSIYSKLKKRSAKDACEAYAIVEDILFFDE